MKQHADFDRQASDALRAAGDALPVTDDVLSRLIAHAQAGRSVAPVRRRQWIPALLAAAVVVAVAIGASLAIWGRSDQHAPPAGTTSPTNVSSVTPTNAPSTTPTDAASTTASTATHSASHTSSPTRPTSPVTRPNLGSDQPWAAPRVTLSVSGLGAVKRGMSLDAAERAAGYTFDGAGDGYHYSTIRDARFGDHLYVGPGLYDGTGPQGPTQCVGATGTTGHQVITTPEGVRLGDPVSRLLAIYGSAATPIAKPPTGLFPRSGYAVNEDGGTLVFAVDEHTHTITGLAAGPTGLTPSQCTG